jgi:hypothetical protein
MPICYARWLLLKREVDYKKEWQQQAYRYSYEAAEWWIVQPRRP